VIFAATVVLVFVLATVLCAPRKAKVKPHSWDRDKDWFYDA